MKTTYTDEQLQAAIDAAFPMGARTDGCLLDSDPEDTEWESEAPNRLSIAKAFLEKLEADPFAELKKAHAEGRVIQFKGAGERWIDLVMGANDPLFAAHPTDSYRIKPEPDTFDAHGKTWTKHTPGVRGICDKTVKVDIIYDDQSTDEAWRAKIVDWTCKQIIGWRYADAPQTNPVPAQDTWTPAVGDVVRLKSGGPKMTVRQYDKEDPADVWCHWFSDAKSCAESFPTACLTKEDAQ